MLNYLSIKNVCLAPELKLDWAPRLNILTGDNGLGKSFLLDIAWWALTRTWAGQAALPSGPEKASIEYVIGGKARETKPVHSVFHKETQAWKQSGAKRPPIPGIVVYIRIDGGFSVWDPARNYWRTDPERPAAFHFNTREVWDGLSINGMRVCEGLERDWVNWQKGREPQFLALEKVLVKLSPLSEPLQIGPPKRVFLGEGWDRPTLLIGGQTVPVALASAGVRRILALAYFIVWSWHEHRVAARLMDKELEQRLIILFDEPETHLHPRWQRTIIPSLLAAVDALKSGEGSIPQLLMATHSPLVLASLEPIFDPEQDDLIHLDLKDGYVDITHQSWARQGDAANWLVSETFGLEQARSIESERAIEAAEAYMREEPNLPVGLDSKENIHQKLLTLLPPHDKFWPRWIVKTNILETYGKNPK